MADDKRKPTADETAGMQWWNLLSEAERATWLARADTAVPAEVWAEYKRRGRVDLPPESLTRP